MDWTYDEQIALAIIGRRYANDELTLDQACEELSARTGREASTLDRALRAARKLWLGEEGYPRHSGALAEVINNLRQQGF